MSAANLTPPGGDGTEKAEDALGRPSRPVLAYLVAALAYLVISDALILLLVAGGEGRFYAGLASNVLFVALSAAAMWRLVRRDAERLRSSEARYRALAEAAHDVIFIIDRDDRVLYVNSFAAAMIGKSPDQLIGTPRSSVFPSEVSARQKASLGRVFETGEALRAEDRLPLPEGRVSWQETYLAPICGEAGRVEAVVGIGRDVTARKQMEAALKESQERFRQVVLQMPYPVEVCDAKGTAVMINEAFLNMFGIPSADLVVGTYNVLEDPFIEELGITEEVRQVYEGRPTVIRDLAIPVDRIDPKYEAGRHGVVYMEITMFPVFDGLEDLSQVVTIWRDVTVRMEADQLKADFTSMVSHELRTPLATIIGYASLLKREDVATDGRAVATTADRLAERTQHMVRLVDDLLEVNRIHSGELNLDVAGADAGELVSRCVAEAASSFAGEIIADLPEGGVPLRCDERRLSYALSNLLSNAAKFSPDGGRIKVTVTHDDGDIRLAVSDQGIGIANGDLGRIFDRFTQADMSSTRSFGGFGMGLFIAQKIVEAHGGRIEVESAQGVGSTFTLVLPAAGPA